MNGMIFRSFQNGIAPKRTKFNTVYSEYSYSRIVPKERALMLLKTVCYCYNTDLALFYLGPLYTSPGCFVIWVESLQRVLKVYPLHKLGLPLCSSIWFTMRLTCFIGASRKVTKTLTKSSLMEGWCVIM